MLNRLYKIFIAPRQTDREVRNREIVLNVLLTSTLLLLLSVLATLVLVFLIGRHYVEWRIFGLGLVALVLFIPYRLSRTGHFRHAAAILIGLYFFIATAIAYRWGIVTPTSLLFYGLVIVLAGILLGPIYPIYFSIGITLLLALLQFLAQNGTIQPDWSWLSKPPDLADVFASAFIFATLALVSWLFNQQMERSLYLAINAERALTKQKALLETTVEERTRELQAAQLEKIQQMYRFAQLGQLSTALMHDLANHLTTLTLNIESLEDRNRSKVLSQAKRSIRHIDDMVIRVRDQLQGRSNVRTFNVAGEIEELVKMLRHRGQIAGVELSYKLLCDKKALRCRGEPIRFRQMMANLISNGIDAYGANHFPAQRREVAVTATYSGSNIIIRVNDWGRGIPEKERPKLFTPFHSTKETGMGMGLFIVKQIAEEHFLGSANIDLSKKHTEFVVELPKAEA